MRRGREGAQALPGQRAPSQPQFLSVTFYSSSYFPLHFRQPDLFLLLFIIIFNFFFSGGRKAYGYFPRCRVSGGRPGLPSSWRARRMRSECSIGPPVKAPVQRRLDRLLPPLVARGDAGLGLGGWTGSQPFPAPLPPPPLPPSPSPRYPPAHPSAAFKARSGRLALSTPATENNELTEGRRRDVEKSWGAEVLYKRFLCTWLRACSLKVKCKT